jgi:polyisoprenyl-phosphate glycosyltransferase
MHPDSPNESAEPTRLPDDPVLSLSADDPVLSLSADDPVLSLSVVIPVYGCQPCLAHLYQRLSTTLDKMGISYEIVLVDDRAEDGSWPEIERLAKDNEAVRGILLSRNFGQHAAIATGLRHSRGAWVSVMDCDLQDPPEVIPQLYHTALEGHDIVFGRRSRKPTSLLRRLLGQLYFGGIRVFGEAHIGGQYGNFSVISRKVTNAFLALRDQDSHYMTILTWLSFDTASVDYDPAPRYLGRSSYTLSRLLEHAFDSVFLQATVLLRWIVYLGFCLAGLGGMLAVYLLAARIFGSVYPGWTSIITAVVVLGGFIILSTGITGLYIGKIFDHIRGRPVFVVDRAIGRASKDRRADGDSDDRSSRLLHAVVHATSNAGS